MTRINLITLALTILFALPANAQTTVPQDTILAWTNKAYGLYEQKNYIEAAKWLQKAAEQGDENAKKLLTEILEEQTSRIFNLVKLTTSHSSK